MSVALTPTPEQVTALNAEITNERFTAVRRAYTEQFVMSLLQPEKFSAPENLGHRYQNQAEENVRAILEGREATRLERGEAIKARKAEVKAAKATTTEKRKPGRPKKADRPLENVAGEAYANLSVGKITPAVRDAEGTVLVAGNKGQWMTAYKEGKALFLNGVIATDGLPA